MFGHLYLYFGRTYRLAIGTYRLAKGAYCLAIGTNCLAIGTYCLAIGTYCLAIGTYCLAVGTYCLAVGPLVQHMFVAKDLGTTCGIQGKCRTVFWAIFPHPFVQHISIVRTWVQAWGYSVNFFLAI